MREINLLFFEFVIVIVSVIVMIIWKVWPETCKYLICPDRQTKTPVCVFDCFCPTLLPWRDDLILISIATRHYRDFCCDLSHKVQESPIRHCLGLRPKQHADGNHWSCWQETSLPHGTVNYKATAAWDGISDELSNPVHCQSWTKLLQVQVPPEHFGHFVQRWHEQMLKKEGMPQGVPKKRNSFLDRRRSRSILERHPGQLPSA